MKKLSEQFLEMSRRAAEWEKRAEARREEDRKQFEADRAEARKSVQSAQAAFDDKLYNLDQSMTSHWREVQKSFNNQVAVAHSKAAEGKAVLELADAQDVADFDEAYADTAANFAHLAANEANAAMLEATAARAYAKSLEKA
jgi:hypothetical protein